MHDNAALQPRGNVAARLSDPVEGVALARGRMQPLQRARDAKTGFVEMPDPGLTDARPDRVIDALEILRLPARPRRQARRADERRAEEVLKRLRRPVLGHKLLHVEIDRRRLDAFAILGRRDHAVGERSPRHAAAMGASVDRGLVLRDLDQPFGQIEHLARLDAGLHRSRQPRPAMATGLSLVPNDPVRRRRSPQRVALWPRCPPLALPERP